MNGSDEVSSKLVYSLGHSRGIGLDLNLPLDYEEPPLHINSHINSKSVEMSEFASTTFNRLPPPVPKHRVRKTKSEMMKRKLEMAKKERVDRFARIAAPSGLFSELNPGIINHVRNSKQVHSIIEALVKSESIKTANVSINSHFINGRKDDNLSLKSLPASGSEVVTSVSSDDNVNGLSALTVKAATVASRWLDLLHQDAKGRLAALRRSRKRARSVIQTDLPSLIAREFSSTICDDTSTLVSKLQTNDATELHQMRWSSLFSHMEMALSEEEKQLEGWVSQVKEMQSQCERGLQKVPWNLSFCPPSKLRVLGDSLRVESTSNETDFAANAAAASIYSTCSFLLNKDEGSR